MDKAGAATGERKANRDDTCLDCNHAMHWTGIAPIPGVIVSVVAWQTS